MPAADRAKNGNIRVMGFPPIGIMSLSSVVKRAGHECVMFDQANPETPNHVIIDEIRRRKPQLVGLSFLSTTSYPYAKILARQIRAADSRVKLAFGGVFATLNAPLVKLQCPEVDFVCRGAGEQLLLDLLERIEDPVAVAGLTWARDGKVVNNPNRAAERDLDQWPFPDREGLPLDFIESMPLDVPAVLSMERFTTMQTSRGCPWP
jgi:anaerobic magnesium-protoporphyrin IX monomethyl ester cyclase